MPQLFIVDSPKENDVFMAEQSGKKRFGAQT